MWKKINRSGIFFLSKPSLDEFQDIFIMEKLYNNIIIIIIKIHDLWGH